MREFVFFITGYLFIYGASVYLLFFH